MRDDVRQQLNDRQLEAVIAIDGPVLVIAGAGSGKTRVIEFRVCHLVEAGINPASILLLTFTRRIHLKESSSLDRSSFLSKLGLRPPSGSCSGEQDG